MTSTTCASWCRNHKTEVDTVDRDDVTEICRAVVTRGDFTVEIEDSPAWAKDPLHGGPIVPPDVVEVGAADARDFAAALIEAARLVDEDRAKR